MTTTLSQATKGHYEELIGQIGNEYIDYRWKRHPVSRSHYRHTRNSILFALGRLGRPAGHLLEIGCGPGTWTDLCLAHAERMTIVDISSEMLKLVRERFNKNSIDFICGDYLVEEVVAPGTFDVIFTSRAVEYMDDKRAVVEKSARLLKEGGVLIIITKNPRWMDKQRESRHEAGPKDDIHGDWVSWADLESYYAASGLENILSYPVCLGSYYAPLNTSLGIKACDLLQERIYRRKIMPGLVFLAESYMPVGQKRHETVRE